jgi:non-canonical purine NTP pyrophosphatase (RdgB/HAM1 family)
MFKFATTNKEKITTARRHLDPLGIQFQEHPLELTELQSDSLIEIALHKAKQAYQQLKEPVVVSDHGWEIPALQGFPGPYMKYVNGWLSSEDFLALMTRHNDKRIIKKEVICYIDHKGATSFTITLTGKFLDAPRGEGLPSMRVVTFLPNGMSAAQCLEQGIDLSDKYTLWEDFARWYHKNSAK